MDFKLENGSSSMSAKGCSKIQNTKLNTYDWLAGVPDAESATDYVEVQFKNTRKGYYLNNSHLPLQKGDVVAVEAAPGHDIGTVTLTGKLVLLQMRKNNYRYDQEPKKVYRKARPNDLEKYEEAKAKEHATMIRARQIAASLGLDMKIGDVEYQGDGNKAIFYYIADERVDFRQLIKVLAEAFRVRIEMKQIGARQEAGRIGGIGPCGRELCCSSWMTSFVSVATSAARYQDVSMNPQKLAGQCAKLKCCINYEIDAYVEASKKLPSREVPLETKDRTYFHFKTDILSGMITYSTDKQMPINAVTIPARRVFEIINMNKRGEKPDSLEQNVLPRDKAANAKDVAAQENVSRFDGKGKRRRKKGNQQAQAQQSQQPQGDKPKQQQGDKPKQRISLNSSSPSRKASLRLTSPSSPSPTASVRTAPASVLGASRLMIRRPSPMHSHRAMAWLAGVALLCSCAEPPIYEQYQAVEQTVWPQDKEYYFIFQVDSPSVPVDISLRLRNNNRYPYQNLWLFVLEERPIGPVLRDTIECLLADDYGKWLGHGISLYESEIPIRQGYTFPTRGQYAITVRQGMRDSALVGIQEIGLIVSPSTARGGMHQFEGI